MKWIFFLLFSMTACLKEDMTPEGAIKTFVEARMGNVVTREFILERVTGKLKQSLENISEEDFKKFSDLRNVKQNSFKILSKSCQEKKCFITYSISYLTKDQDKMAFTSEVKKIAEVVSEGGKWLIAEVSNVKTYHEALETLNP